jgi:hypothetical protein
MHRIMWNFIFQRENLVCDHHVFADDNELAADPVLSSIDDTQYSKLTRNKRPTPAMTSVNNDNEFIGVTGFGLQ